MGTHKIEKRNRHNIFELNLGVGPSKLKHLPKK